MGQHGPRPVMYALCNPEAEGSGFSSSLSYDRLTMVCYELHNSPEPQREAGIQPTSQVSFEISIRICKIFISSSRSKLRELEAHCTVSHFLRKDGLEELQSYPERLPLKLPSAGSEPRPLGCLSYGRTVKQRLLARISRQCGNEHDLNRFIAISPSILRLQASDRERCSVNNDVISDPKGHLYTTDYFLPDLDSAAIRGYKDHSVSSVWLPTVRATLNITLLSVLLLALAKLIPLYKLLLADFKSQDLLPEAKLQGLLSNSELKSQNAHLLVLLFITWLPVGLLQVVRRQVKPNSSPITIIIVTLSCYVNLTDSAPLHLPNLLIRGTAGGNGTYIVPLEGSPNTGYCAKITIGIKPYPQEVIAQKITSGKNKIYFIKTQICFVK